MWVRKMVARMFASDSFLIQSVLQGDALSRFLAIAKPNRQEVKSPCTGWMTKEEFLSLLPEFDQELEEDIAKGRQLVSEKVWFSIWPLPRLDSGEHRAAIWLATKDMFPMLPLPIHPSCD